MEEENLKNLSEAKVLLVEDNANNRKMFSQFLNILEITKIQEAENGEEALAALKKDSDFDLILLDIVMPKMSGDEFIDIIKKDPNFSHIPVLVMTGSDTSVSREKMFKAGANDYITKPVSPMEFFSRVKVHLENHILIKRLKSQLNIMEKDLSLARKMQDSLLPDKILVDSIPNLYKMKLETHFEISKKLGRSFWRMNKIDSNSFIISIGAFAGEGMSAAINILRINTILEEWNTGNIKHMAAVIKEMNDKLTSLFLRGQNLPLCLILVNTQSNKIEYLNAGYSSPIMVFSNGDIKVLDSKSPPLGLNKSSSYTIKEIPFIKGSKLFLYCDLFINGKDRNNRHLGIEGVKHLAATSPSLDSAIKEFKDRMTKPLQDDLIALMLTKT